MDVVRLYEQLCGRTATVTHVPLGMLRFASRLMRRVHPGLSQIMLAGVLDDTVAQQFDAGPIQERFGFELTRLEDWVAETVNVLSDDLASMRPAA